MPRLASPLLLALLQLAACERAAEPAEPATTPVATAASVADAAAQGPSIPALVKVAILQDSSGSVPDTRTPKIGYQDIERIVHALEKRELDIGFGLINDRGDEPLVRVRLVPAPSRPPEALAPPPPGNVFARLRVPQLLPREPPAFERTLEEWRKDREEKLATFQEAVTKLLALPARGCTDLESALARIAIMVGETEVRFPGAGVRTYGVLVTDGLHTAKGRPTLKSIPAEILAVNGSGTIGGLERFKPLMFESPARAVAHVIDVEVGYGQRRARSSRIR